MGSGAKHTVLVVEDEPLIRLFAVEMIQEAGWLAIEAADASEALASLSSEPNVHVLFTDINMPGEMDGLQLADHVHRLHPNIHLVITSGKRVLADSALPDDGTFLPKPYVYEQLVKTIECKLQA